MASREAAEQGTFNVGAAHAAVARVPDPAAGGEVLKLTYTIPTGTTAGVYAKGFPPELRRRARRPRARGRQGRRPRTRAGRSPPRSRSRARRASSGSPWSSSPTGIRSSSHRLAGHRGAEGSRPPGQRHRRSRARRGDDPDRRPVRAALSAPRLSMSLAARFGGVILAGLVLSFAGRTARGNVGPAIAGRRGDPRRGTPGAVPPAAAVGRGACSSRISSRASGWS